MKYMLKVHIEDNQPITVVEFVHSEDARAAAMGLRKNYPKGAVLEVVEDHGHGLLPRHHEAYIAIGQLGVDPAEYRGADYGND